MEAQTQQTIQQTTEHLIGRKIVKIEEDSVCGEIRIFLDGGKLICLQAKLEINEYWGIRPRMHKNFNAGHAMLGALPIK